MAPGREDLLIILGAAFSQTFSLQGRDLSGWQAIAVFRAFPWSSHEILILRDGDGLALGDNGAITMTLTEEQTRAWVESLPRFMTSGPFPGQGTSGISPGAYSGKLGSWALKLLPLDAPAFILLEGSVCFSRNAASLTAFPAPPTES